MNIFHRKINPNLTYFFYLSIFSKKQTKRSLSVFLQLDLSEGKSYTLEIIRNFLSIEFRRRTLPGARINSD